MAVVAVPTGANSLAAIGEWAADAPGRVLAALGVRRDLLTRAFRPPGEATVRRVLARIDAEALDRAIGAWLASQQPPPANPPPPPAPRPWRQGSRSTARPCAAAATTKPAGPLLAAMDHTSRAVLAQTDVDTTSNEITQFQPCWRAWTGVPPDSSEGWLPGWGR